jgi:uncharacterized protein (DUF305 family)
MSKNATLALIVVVALLGGLAIGYGIRTDERESRQNTGRNAGMGGMMMGDNIDQGFIEQMIPHHEGAIAMATIALERSERPEMLALARAIIEAQQKEITDMRAWHKAWFGAAVPSSSGSMMMHMGGMTGDPAALRTVPAAEFDREFIVQMIPHHEMAVMMASMLARGTARPEMKQLAANIIASQSKEITMMRGWLTDWRGNPEK